MTRRVLVAALLTLALPAAADAQGLATEHLTDGVGADAALDASPRAVSPSGDVVVFESEERLVPADGDSALDVYARTPAGLVLVSDSPDGTDEEKVAFTREVTPDGTRIVFQTGEAMLGTDGDANPDGYRFTLGGGLTLVTPGTASAAYVSHQSADGERVTFSTYDQATGTDTDASLDLFQRGPGGSLAHLSNNGLAPDGAANVTFDGASADGTTVFMRTSEALNAGDGDTADDVYRWRAATGGAPTAVSEDAGTADAETTASFAGASTDGSRMYFRTIEAIDADDDQDSVADIYEAASPPRLVTDTSGPDAAAHADVEAVSDDGSRVVFTTTESHVPSDGDAVADAYDVDDLHGPRHVTEGPSDLPEAVDVKDASADALRLVVVTEEPMLVTDTDTQNDVYETVSSADPFQPIALRHVSDGTGGTDAPQAAYFVDAVPGGGQILFRTVEPLAASDADPSDDVYERTAAGELLHISDDPTGPDRTIDFGVGEIGGMISADGTERVVYTEDMLATSDTDQAYDLFGVHAAPPTGETVTPGGGGGGGGGDAVLPGADTRDLLAPVISSLRVSRRIRSGRRKLALLRAGRRGSIRLTLSESARLQLTFSRARVGWRSRGRCRTTTRKGRRCTVYRRAARAAVNARAGAVAIRFAGRVSKRRLRPGRYRVAVVATDAAGNRSTPVRAGFWLLQAPRRRR